MTLFKSLIPLLAASLAAPLSASEFTTVGVRGPVGTGDDTLITGFEIEGNEPKKVLVVAVGPSLADEGVKNVLANPWVSVHDAFQHLLAFNKDWDGDEAIQATGKAPKRANEAALIITLPPGSYSAVVHNEGGASGNAGLAVFDLKSLTGEGPSTAEKLCGRWTGIQRYTINGEQCQWQLLQITFDLQNGLIDFGRTLNDQSPGISRFHRNCSVNIPKKEKDSDGNTTITVDNLPDRALPPPLFSVRGDTLNITAAYPKDFTWPATSHVSVAGDQATITHHMEAGGLDIDYRFDLVRADSFIDSRCAIPQQSQ